MKIHHLKRCSLSKSNTFNQNFMKLGHIVQYQDVLFKFDNGPYCVMLSVVMALCTMMSSSSLIMVHIAPCFQWLWPFVYEISTFESMSAF